MNHIPSNTTPPSSKQTHYTPSCKFREDLAQSAFAFLYLLLVYSSISSNDGNFHSFNSSNLTVIAHEVQFVACVATGHCLKPLCCPHFFGFTPEEILEVLQLMQLMMALLCHSCLRCDTACNFIGLISTFVSFTSSLSRFILFW
jgi:hypothetical protein